MSEKRNFKEARAQQLYQTMRNPRSQAVEREAACDELSRMFLTNREEQAHEYFTDYWTGTVRNWLEQLAPEMPNDIMKNEAREIIDDLVIKARTGAFQYLSPQKLASYLKTTCRNRISARPESRHRKRAIIAGLKKGVERNSAPLSHIASHLRGSECDPRYSSSTISRDLARQLLLFSFQNVPPIRVVSLIFSDPRWRDTNVRGSQYKTIYSKQQTVLWNFYKFLKRIAGRRGLLGAIREDVLRDTEAVTGLYFVDMDQIELTGIARAEEMGRSAAVTAALASLPEKERVVLLLVYDEHVPVEDVPNNYPAVGSIQEARCILKSATMHFKMSYERFRSIE